MTKKYSISIREFALPSPRMGSIDVHSGMGRSLQDGQEIHLRVQKRRAETDSCYEAEVQITQEFEREGFTFQVGGRMDGLFSYSEPRAPLIEEIKTSFNLRELKRNILDPELDHPITCNWKLMDTSFTYKIRSFPNFHFTWFRREQRSMRIWRLN
jgi:DNA excision repair protein ERCC-2